MISTGASLQKCLYFTGEALSSGQYTAVLMTDSYGGTIETVTSETT
jgi:hypothetical protein